MKLDIPSILSSGNIFLSNTRMKHDQLHLIGFVLQ